MGIFQKHHPSRYYEPRGPGAAEAEGPATQRAFDFALFLMKPSCTTVVVTDFTFDANRRAE